MLLPVANHSDRSREFYATYRTIDTRSAGNRAAHPWVQPVAQFGPDLCAVLRTCATMAHGPAVYILDRPTDGPAQAQFKVVSDRGESRETPVY